MAKMRAGYRRLVPARIMAWIIGLSAAFAGIYGFQSFAPRQAAEWTAQWRLWRSGVVRVDLGGLSALRAERCGGGGQAQSQGQAKAKSSDHPCSCVVLIHGLGDSAMTWRNLLESPLAEWRSPVDLYAVDLPGSGSSPPENDPANYSARRMAERLGRGLAAVSNCSSWLVVGNSFGGSVAAWLALRSSDDPGSAPHVRKLMLVDTSGLKAQREDPASGFIAALLKEPTIEGLKEFQRRAYAQARELPEAYWRAAAQALKASPVASILAAQSLSDDLDGVASSIHVTAAMVLWGAADRITAPGEGKLWASSVPGAVYREIPGCGHLPQKECPAEVLKALNELVLFGVM